MIGTARPTLNQRFKVYRKRRTTDRHSGSIVAYDLLGQVDGSISEAISPEALVGDQVVSLRRGTGIVQNAYGVTADDEIEDLDGTRWRLTSVAHVGDALSITATEAR